MTKKTTKKAMMPAPKPALKVHNWFRFCIRPGDFAQTATLSQFVRTLHAQSNDAAALIPYREYAPGASGTTNGKSTIGAPRYFGAGIEALAEIFFRKFGEIRYNMVQYRSHDTQTEELEDTGYDATALSAVAKTYGKQIQKAVQAGSPVFVQVKGRLNATSELSTNDGSNVMNFFANAQAVARKEGKAYTSRYVLFTTAKGLHWKLEANTYGDIEVIGAKEIATLTKNNVLFWNEFRAHLGMPDVPIECKADPEFRAMRAALENASDDA